MSPDRTSPVARPVHELVARRWSPYAFDESPLSDDDLLALFEAARWAASAFNEQPWRYVVARREDEAAFARLLGCLVEGNRPWARHASVLALGIVRSTFTRNDRPNRCAEHDLGAASATLTFEATSRGLVVHQMAGIVPDLCRETYAIPEGFTPVTALAIGRAGRAPGLDEAIAARDARERSRRPLAETVFAGTWGRAAFGSAGD